MSNPMIHHPRGGNGMMSNGPCPGVVMPCLLDKEWAFKLPFRVVEPRTLGMIVLPTIAAHVPFPFWSIVVDIDCLVG